MNKNQIINQLLRHVCDALVAQLPDKEYSEFLGGGIDFHLDLPLKHHRHFVRLKLPAAPKKDPKPLEVVFKRRHARLIDRISPKETVN
jgi:hypothetical protein